jgi:hypothetical protein
MPVNCGSLAGSRQYGDRAGIDRHDATDHSD